VVPALVLTLGFDLPEAIGTSLLVIAIDSFVALAARVTEHVHLDWSLLGPFAAITVLDSLVGNRIASRVDARKLTLGLVALLVGIAVYTSVQSLPRLLA
jgi:uncharacterized membrane protein YfcA